MTLRNMTLALSIAAIALAQGACGGVDETGLVGLEDCSNGVDDNGDGRMDCEDTQCLGHAYCLGYSEFLCDNGVDDDDDGATDCDDPDCLQTAACDPTREWSCHDSVDNDSDGLTDCRDPDCSLSDACHENCGDGVDNDGDGMMDCEDDQCTFDPICVPEFCSNGVDDDGDGLVDCEDEECETTGACADVERCNDGEDNDGDGMTDCEDPECAGNPWCHELQCADGVDNDNNGLVDCDDAACTNQPGCITNQTCQPAATIFCDYLIAGNTLGRLDNLDTYACEPGLLFDGGERYFRLGVFPGTEVIVELTDYTTPKNLQMFVVGRDNTGPGCAPFGPCDTPDNTSVTEQIVDASHEQFRELYIIVDSVGPGGEFDLYVDCHALEEQDCTNNGDDDNDGLVDCNDPDCQLTPDCPGETEICDNNVDDDYDSLTDCNDPYCYGEPPCSGEQDCTDGADDDGDGATDCADPDCWANEYCSIGVTHCDDNVDDDGVGVTDCWDIECVGTSVCDYWFDFDTPCMSDNQCGPPNHFCVHLGPGNMGFCSTSCATPGALDYECDTHTTLQGFCLPSAFSVGIATGSHCVLPCGAAYPNHFCPPNWTCHHPDPSLTDYGVCVP